MKFNAKNNISPIGSPEKPSPYNFESPKNAQNLMNIKEPVRNTAI